MQHKITCVIHSTHILGINNISNFTEHICYNNLLKLILQDSFQ